MMAGMTGRDREAGAQIAEDTTRFLREACRNLGLPEPAPLTYRDEVALARIQVQVGLCALDADDYTQALVYFRDAVTFMEKTVQKIAEAAKRGETTP